VSDEATTSDDDDGATARTNERVVAARRTHGVSTRDGEAHQTMLRRERTERGRGGAQNAEKNGEE
jgi:hypothetical protein